MIDFVPVKISKFLMKWFESIPVSPEIEIGELQEVFNHSSFVNGSDSQRKLIMLKSSERKYESEIKYPWDNYFGIDLAPFLQGRVILDLGCFNGGRSAAWFERYRPDHLIGIDVKKEYIDAATQFAKVKNIRAEFILGKGESLHFGDEKFDAILSFDVFEHVQDLERTLDTTYASSLP